MTETSNTPERPTTLDEFHAAQAAANAAAEDYTSELSADAKYAVFTGYAQVIEWQLYDGRPNYENVANQTVSQLSAYDTISDGELESMRAAYLEEHAS